MQKWKLSLGLAACLTGCDGTDGVLSSSFPNPLTTPVPAASRPPARTIPSPEPLGFGSGVPISPNGSITNAPSTNGTNVSNPAAPALPRDLGSEVAVSYSSDVVDIFKGYCYNCHSPGGTGHSSLALFDSNGFADYRAIRDNILNILVSVTAGTMPPQGVPVPSSQQTLLKSWQRQGLQLN